VATSITNTSVTTDNLTVDTNTIHVDSANNRVGIGTTTPNNPLEITHTGSVGAGGLRIGDPSTIASDTGIYLRTTGDAVIGAAGGNIVFDTNMAVQEDMRIDTNGYVTMPNQPHCMLYKSGNQAISSGSTQAVTGWAVSNGLNSMFSSANNRIIAPVGGTYIVGGMIQFSAAGGVHISILKNNAAVGNDSYLDFGANGSAGAAAYSMVIPMNTNDWVSVSVYNTVSSNVNANRSKLWLVKVS